MPTPRVFVSSTCYDLLEIRQNLRQFVLDFSYDPVMSEFGDIFYEYDSHIQDACLKEIEKCQLFILIVGNNYGSLFHRQQNVEVPDSVTLREFKKAISVEIPKHIFINRFVHYDYTNYRRALDNKLKEYFDANQVSDEKVKATVLELRKKLDNNYTFANKAYKYIFYFLDLISELKVNNAIFPFETFVDIQSQLKKQWAGYVYDNLTREKSVALSTVDNIAVRIERIETLLNQLLISKSDNTNGLSLDIIKLADSVAYNDLREMQQLISDCLQNIMYYVNDYDRFEDRGYIKEELNATKIINWFQNLKAILNKYKWAGFIPFAEIWGELKVMEAEYSEEVPYKTLLDLMGLFEKLPDDEKNNLASTIALKLRPIVRVDNPYEEPTFNPDDDIPF